MFNPNYWSRQVLIYPVMQLEQLIIEKIKAEGPMPFHEFMEMCLYYPGLGFYTAHSSIGKEGAFYTSAYLTPVFGAMIGRKLEEMWRDLGSKKFTVIEYGAGTGMLSHDILSYLKHYSPELYDLLSYVIIEKSPVMREIEKTHLPEKVVWYDTIADAGAIEGCILSNELVDNFAVHQVVMAGDLMEVYVTYDHGFAEILQPAGPAVRQYMEELDITLPRGFRTEVNLQATHWIGEVSRALQRGYVMTIDYGCGSEELYKPCRSKGTLLCYRNHTINDSCYSHIGAQDITSHVNFSALSHWGERYGLKQLWFTDQCQFLLSMGFTDFLQQALSTEKDVLQAARKASVISHTLLFDMGSRFKVLLQEKVR